MTSRKKPASRPFDTVLVANRGEIAMRVFRTARALGLRTVAVYSDADADMPHARAADCAVAIGAAPARESYLAIDKLIAAARATGAQAIHPGYGFLSESEAFAAACRDAGLIFVGPSPEAIRAMANKATAKRIMQEAGVPCIPGYDGAKQDDDTFAREAARIGWPVMVKAVAGGGGKGMRLVTSAADLPEALRGARSEALKYFADGALMLEKAVVKPRHVEVQVFGDDHGNVVYLGDRDCSVQRRHQKILEEAPAPGLSAGLRARMGEAAVKAARAVHYTGAGTVEFLVGADEAFFFLEMNTRLQVEHPVTEMVTGLDLVTWQFRVAAGEPLPLEQAQIKLEGHAIEARVYAEDPAAQFLPQSGRLLTWSPPAGTGIRVDHGLAQGDVVSTHYDPMIAKVIAFGADRDQARRRLAAAIDRFAIGGLRNNLDFLRHCLLNADFAAAKLDTAFLDRHTFDDVLTAVPDRPMIAVAAALLQERAVHAIDPALRNWRSRPWRPEPLILTSGAWRGVVQVAAEPNGIARVSDAAGTIAVRLLSRGPIARVRVDGVDMTVRTAWQDEQLHVTMGPRTASFAETRATEARGAAKDGAILRAPMPGSILDVRVSAGALVQSGQVLMILEAMKMEHQIQAPVSGRIASVSVSAGRQVGMREILVEIVAEEGQ